MMTILALLAETAQPDLVGWPAVFQLGGTVTVAVIFIFYLTNRDKAQTEHERSQKQQLMDVFDHCQKRVDDLTTHYTESTRYATGQLRELTEANLQVTRETVVAIGQLRASVEALREEIRDRKDD